MPKYKNNGTIAVVVGGVRIEPNGGIGETLEFEQTLPANVVWVSDLPNHRPIIFSNKFTASATIGVPANYIDSKGVSVPLKGYEIEVYVGVGECTVNINDNTTVSEYVGLYQKKIYSGHYFCRLSGYFMS